VFGGDTFVNGVHGFKCCTLDDFVYATKNAHKLDPRVIRSHAEKFLIDNVKWEFQSWFEDLHQLYLSTTDSSIKGWHHLRKEEPEWRNKILGGKYGND
jgi:hypothetical protein